MPIAVSDEDWFYSKFGIRCMEFIRSAPSTRIDCDLGWREQISQVTAYIDASTVYGSDPLVADSLRLFRNGKRFTRMFACVLEILNYKRALAYIRTKCWLSWKFCYAIMYRKVFKGVRYLLRLPPLKQDNEKRNFCWLNSVIIIQIAFTRISPHV